MYEKENYTDVHEMDLICYETLKILCGNWILYIGLIKWLAKFMATVCKYTEMQKAQNCNNIICYMTLTGEHTSKVNLEKRKCPLLSFMSWLSLLFKT